jgi:biotin carboxyl carrier protein
LSSVDVELLDRLTAWMQEGGFTRLTYTRGKSTVTLRLPEGAIARPSLPLRTINSPSIGAFLASHPLADRPYVEIGRSVGEGDIVALLAIGPVLLPVEATCSGIVRGVLRREGEVVGFDDQLFEIEPTEG